eukprot:scaffold2196_cov259-Chaetoceros_neogracile.AAC.23
MLEEKEKPKCKIFKQDVRDKAEANTKQKPRSLDPKEVIGYARNHCVNDGKGHEDACHVPPAYGHPQCKEQITCDTAYAMNVLSLSEKWQHHFFFHQVIVPAHDLQ